ncbi:MAG: preprotein translocase subunit SecY [Phycisphaeraceae bacterium]|nr:preprotein translocase subunit SecY [Phycisphaeraceae bacterium]
MLQALISVFRIPELRTKILFTIGMLAVYRIGYWIPVPGVDQTQLVKHFEQAMSQEGGSAAARLASFVSVFSGGAFGHSTVFGLGIMPYISASIIFQLFGTVIPRLKKLQEEGPTGRQKITEWTRLATVGLCLVQGAFWLKYIVGSQLVYEDAARNPMWWITATAALTAGTVFLMWLGEQIDKYGIGNGVSMIITAGILTRMPAAITWVAQNFQPGTPGKLGFPAVFFLIACFVIVVAGSVLLTVAQRRIPIQQAKHTRGRKVFGGQKSYLPLRVNHGGVMPIIFASSLMIFPSVVAGMLYQQARTIGGSDSTWTVITRWFSDSLGFGSFLYVILEVVLIYFFSYFWITVQFNPEDISKQLKEHGSFIPGLRPGPRTAEYLETVMERLTFVGAAFLCVLATTPNIVSRGLNINQEVTQFLGGTGLLIVVAVILDFIQRVEANLLMRNYAGFLGSSAETGRGRAMRGPR